MEQPKQAPAGPLGRAAGGIVRIGQGICLWAGIVVLALLSVCSFLLTAYFSRDTYSEKVLYRFDNPLLMLGGALVLLGLFFILLRRGLWQKLPQKSLERLLYLWLAAAGIAWVLMARAHPYAEPDNLLIGAGAFQAGDFSGLEPQNYYGFFPYQLGYTAFLEVLMVLFGQGNYLAAQLFNVAFLVAAFFALLRCGQLMFGEGKPLFCLTLLCFMFFPPVLFSTHVYGLLPGLAFAMLGLWQVLRYLKTRSRASLWCALPLTALACVMKNNYLIFAIAMALVLLLDLLKNRRTLLLLFIPALLLACFFALSPLYRIYEARAGDTLKIGKGSPFIMNIAMGLQEGPLAPGWFNSYNNTGYVNSGYNSAIAAENAGKDIQKSLAAFLQKPGNAARFFFLKTISQWSEPTNQCFWISYQVEEHKRQPRSVFAQSLYQGKLNTLATGFMNVFSAFLFAMAFCGLLLGRKKFSLPDVLLLATMLGGFFCHLVWEGKSQYVLPYIFLLLPYAATGVAGLCEKLAPALEKLRARIKPHNASAGTAE